MCFYECESVCECVLGGSGAGLLLSLPSSCPWPPRCPSPWPWGMQFDTLWCSVCTDSACPGSLSPPSAQPGGFRELRVVGCPLPSGHRVFLSGAPRVPLTGPFSPRPLFLAEPWPALQSRLPRNDSFQLMSSSGFKALVTLKESLFPRWKRKAHKSRAVDYNALPDARGCSRLPTPAGFSHATWGSAHGPRDGSRPRSSEQRFGQGAKEGSEDPHLSKTARPTHAS